MTLALDLGTKTGWAVTTSTGKIKSGTIKLDRGRFTGGGRRFVAFEEWLIEIRREYRFIEVFFEEVRRHRGTDAAHVYGGLLAVLTKWCEQQVPVIPYEGVPVGEIKRHATGKGNADKPQMIAAMQALGHSPKDDNEADALAILHLRLAQKNRLAMSVLE